MSYTRLAELAVDSAQKLGAIAAEAYLFDGSSNTVEVADSKLSMLKLSKDAGIGLRIITAQKTVGFAFTAGLDTVQVKQLALQAIENGRRSFADQYHSLPNSGDKPTLNEELLDSQLRLTSIEDKILLAFEIEKAARNYDPRITKIEKCLYQDVQYDVIIRNSNGLDVSYRSGYCGLYGAVLASENGDTQGGHSLNYCRSIKKLSPEQIGQDAAQNAIQLLGGKSIKTVCASIILSPYIASSFLSLFASSFSSDAVHKGKSIFKGKLNNKVLSDQITIIDDGRLSGGIVSCPVDGEGVGTQRTELIRNGEIRHYLYNTYTANVDNTASTGNAVRNSFKSVTEVGPSNIYIEAGTLPPAELIRSIDKGLYITNVMGLHTANPISGDFSVGASGVWIENGEMTHAVRGVAIAGNLLELFSRIDRVGMDLRFFGSRGAPSLHIPDVTISGD